MKLIDDLRQHPRKLLLLLLVLAGLLIFGYHQREHLNREALLSFGKGISAAWFVIGFITLPLLGFPVSIFLVLSGVRFGFWGGMGLAALSMVIHHTVAFHVVHSWFRRRVRNWLEHKGYPVPQLIEKSPVWFTAIFAAVHGPPYVVKVYSLALTDLPFRIYFWAGAPVYILFSAIPVGAGSAVISLNPTWIYSVVFGMLMLTLLSHWLGKRL